MVEPEVVFNKISKLKTADDIATYLGFEGVTGTPSQADRCPLANYFSLQTGLDCSVDSTEIVFFKEDGEELFFFNSDAMCSFVPLFDEGWYPDLIDTSYFEGP